MDTTKLSGVVMANTAYKQSLAPQVLSSNQTKDSSSQTSAPTSKKEDSVQVSSTIALKNLDTVRVIEQMHASLNQLAKGVRETNESVNKAVDQIDSMKSSINEVVKNFPPFPINSKERNQRLMEYNSLRKELVSLMVPPPPPPIYEKVKHAWSMLFDDMNGQFKAEAVPELNNNSSDVQLKEASQTLDITSKQLTDFSNEVTRALVQP